MILLAGMMMMMLRKTIMMMMTIDKVNRNQPSCETDDRRNCKKSCWDVKSHLVKCRYHCFNQLWKWLCLWQRWDVDKDLSTSRGVNNEPSNRRAWVKNFVYILSHLDILSGITTIRRNWKIFPTSTAPQNHNHHNHQPMRAATPLTKVSVPKAEVSKSTPRISTKAGGVTAHLRRDIQIFSYES